MIWYFPKIRGTLLGVPIIRLIVFFGVFVGVPLFWETTNCLGAAVKMILVDSD